MKIPINEIKVRSLDLETFFDTLYDYVLLNPKRRKVLGVSVLSKNTKAMGVVSLSRSGGCRAFVSIARMM
jgi:hypothetical protein